jgi:chromate transporter
LRGFEWPAWIIASRPRHGMKVEFATNIVATTTLYYGIGDRVTFGVRLASFGLERQQNHRETSLNQHEQETTTPSYTLWQMILYMLRLGGLGFGGPIALVGYMHRDLVEGRKWISEADYKEGLALAQLAPGPLAAQLGIYMGYVHYRIVGATLAGLAFVMPSFLMVVALGWAYVRFGGLAWMQAVFYGVGAAVIGIIAMSAKKLTAKSIGKDKLLWAIYLLLAGVTIVTESEMAWLFIAAGVLVWLLRAPPGWLPKGGLHAIGLAQLPAAPAVFAALDIPLLTQIGVFFIKAGAFVFGSGLAIVPFLYGGVVTGHHWLTDKQFVDAVAVAMITPGPVVITVGFIGYLVAGLAGATVAALATFIPCYLFTVIPAPYFKKYGKLPGMLAFVDGITAAAIGAIAGSVVVIARRSIIDIPTGLIAVATVALLWKFKKLQEPVVVAAAAAVGLFVYPLLHH